MSSKGYFYFIDDSYFKDFPDSYIMKNKEKVNGQLHDRPTYFAFEGSVKGLYWVIPFSSKVPKYKQEEQKKIRRYGRCDTIKFGEVLGFEKAFLIQNMCPVTDKYLSTRYDHKGVPVQIVGTFESELLKSAKRVLALHRKGFNLIFPDVFSIEKMLIEQLNGS
jgi:hypothetical protein